MIVESILNLFFYPILWLMDLVPEFVVITIPNGIFGSIQGWIQMAANILPVNTVLTLFQIKLSILALAITWNIILRVKSFIPVPTAGN